MLIKPGIQLHALHRTFAVHNTFIKQIVTETVTTNKKKNKSLQIIHQKTPVATHNAESL